MKPRKPMSKARAKEKADKIEALVRGEEVDEPKTVDLGGRPTAYKPEYVDQVAKLCAMGATDHEMAEFFGVCAKTFYNWQSNHPEFLHSIQISKDAHDNRVERSLYQKAVGYERTVEKATACGQVVTVKEFYPPDTASAIFWLKNRRSGKWKDRQDLNHNHTLSLSEEFEGFMRKVFSNPGHQPTELLEIHSSEYQEIPSEYPASEGEESKTIP